MKIEQVKTRDIKPYKLNAKKHPKEQIEGLAESIKRFGFTQPIVVDKNNEIIIGHGRLEAAKSMDMKDVPCLRLEKLSEAEVKGLRLIDNRIAETGWDQDLLTVDLEDFDFDFESFNIDFDDLKLDVNVVDGECDEDEVPQVPEEPRTKPGDIYELGDHRLMCGDSTNIQHVEKLIDGEKIDMVFTDPPYNVAFNGRSGKHDVIKVDKNIKNESDLWQIKKDTNYKHPTQKPVELSVRAFGNHIKKINVLDLFGGSGSTLIGAEQTRRKAFLMELDPKYCDVIVDRWEKFTGKKAKLIQNDEF